MKEIKISKNILLEMAGEKIEETKKEKPVKNDAQYYFKRMSGIFDDFIVEDKKTQITLEEFYSGLIKEFKDDAKTISKIRKIYQGELHEDIQ